MYELNYRKRGKGKSKMEKNKEKITKRIMTPNAQISVPNSFKNED